MDYRYSTDYSAALAALCEEFQSANGLEVGLECGQSALAFLSASTPRLGRLTSVDPENLTDGCLDCFGERWCWLKGLSQDMLPTLQPGYDWCFIDGDHGEESVFFDLTEADRLVSPGGIVICHDFGRPTAGVEPAVRRFLSTRDYTLRASADSLVWWQR